MHLSRNAPRAYTVLAAPAGGDSRWPSPACRSGAGQLPFNLVGRQRHGSIAAPPIGDWLLSGAQTKTRTRPSADIAVVSP